MVRVETTVYMQHEDKQQLDREAAARDEDYTEYVRELIRVGRKHVDVPEEVPADD